MTKSVHSVAENSLQVRDITLLIDRNVLGLFQGFTYALLLTNLVNGSKVYIGSKHSFFHWEKLLLLSKGGSCSTVMVTKGKGNMSHSGGFSFIFSQMTKTGLRNHSPDEGDFFPVSLSICQVYAKKCSEMFHIAYLLSLSSEGFSHSIEVLPHSESCVFINYPS